MLLPTTNKLCAFEGKESSVRFVARERLIGFHGLGTLDPAGEGFSLAWDLPCLFAFQFFRVLSVCPNLHGTTIEVGTPLNRKRLVVNIAHYMCLRFQMHLSCLNWTFDSSVHHHTFGYNDSVDMCARGDD